MKKIIALLILICLCMTSVVFASADGTGKTVVSPYEWDTQFKPETAISTYNMERYKRLSNIGDDNSMTTYEWLIVSAERGDNIPELTAYFRGSTMNAIGIRNGNLASADEYFYYSRATGFTLWIYDIYGNMNTVKIEIPDQYTKEYQVFQLGRTFENVSRVEFWLDSFNFDPNNTRAGKYLLYIADIQFYNIVSESSDAVYGHNPLGNVDMAYSGNNGMLTLAGWAFDPDSHAYQPEIHVYIGGPAGSGATGYNLSKAAVYRKDVDDVYHCGAYHGFDVTFSVPERGKYEIYIYAVNDQSWGVTDNSLIGRMTVDIN